jgi:hypothetical protein
MKNIVYISAFLGLIIASCGGQDDDYVSNPLMGKVYLFGIDFDENKCDVLAQCDCCAFHLSFIDESQFISTTYCMGDEGYRKGKYKLIDDTLTLIFDNKHVKKEYNWDVEIDTTGSETQEHFIETSNLPPLTQKISVFYCQDKLFLKNESNDGVYFGQVDKTTVREMRKNMENDDIWGKLECY